MSNPIPVVMLCGGRGIAPVFSSSLFGSEKSSAAQKSDEKPTRIAKGMVFLRNHPMFIHVVAHYARNGFEKFHLSCGSDASRFESYLATLPREQNGNFKIDYYGTSYSVSMELHKTGDESNTGERLLKLKPLLTSHPYFCVAYSDILSDVNIQKVVSFHLEHGRSATLVSASMPTRFRILGIKPGSPRVTELYPKFVMQSEKINGGFYVFSSSVLEVPYLGLLANEPLEGRVLERLANESELFAYSFNDRWQHFDSERDLEQMEFLLDQILMAQKV